MKHRTLLRHMRKVVDAIAANEVEQQCSGVLVIDADTPEEWEAKLAELGAVPAGPDDRCGYLVVPRTLTMEEWLAKYGTTTQ